MADIPTVSWSELTPTADSVAALGDDRIREMKTQIREVIDVDHDFPSSGQADDVGQHKRVTLQEQADLGSGAVGTTILGSQTISGKGELVYTDEDDNDIQLTKGGVIAFTSTANLAALINLIYPVGSFYANDAVPTNPGTLFGVGTWVAVEEQVIAGYKSGSTEFGTIGTYAGGEKQHALTEAELAAHTHAGASGVSFYGTGTGSNIASGGGFTFNNMNATASAGSGTAHNNIQPTYVAYLWRRTA